MSYLGVAYQILMYPLFCRKEFSFVVSFPIRKMQLHFPLDKSTLFKCAIGVCYAPLLGKEETDVSV